jgi:hypothetical protein
LPTSQTEADWTASRFGAWTQIFSYNMWSTAFPNSKLRFLQS